MSERVEAWFVQLWQDQKYGSLATDKEWGECWGPYDSEVEAIEAAKNSTYAHAFVFTEAGTYVEFGESAEIQPFSDDAPRVATGMDADNLEDED